MLNPLTWFQPITKRGLTAGEREIAYSVFADKLVVDDIFLCTHPLVLKGYAVSPNGNIYFHKEGLPTDFANESLAIRSWFVHELTHVWQIQQGLKVVRRAVLDRRYNYVLETSKDFFKYGIEQQAQMVQDYYLARERGENCDGFESCIPFL